jgi:hypothetical protein
MQPCATGGTARHSPYATAASPTAITPQTAQGPLKRGAVVHPANVQDRDGGPLVIESIARAFSFVTKLSADGGYQGPQFRKALAKVMPQLSVEIV